MIETWRILTNMVYTIDSMWRLLMILKPMTVIYQLNNGLWSNLLSKTAIIATFYFPAEK